MSVKIVKKKGTTENLFNLFLIGEDLDCHGMVLRTDMLHMVNDMYLYTDKCQ